MGVTLARAAVAGLGALLVLAGAAMLVALGPAGFLPAVFVFGTGAVLLVAAVIERLRYRSLHADRVGDPVGPGGGEPAGMPLEPRFRPTPEVFLDPTTHVRMRVFVDPRSGERRYVPEG